MIGLGQEEQDYEVFFLIISVSFLKKIIEV